MSTKTPTSRLLSAKEIGPLVNLAPRTVLDLAREKKIPHLKLGRTYRFILDDIIKSNRR